MRRSLVLLISVFFLTTHSWAGKNDPNPDREIVSSEASIEDNRPRPIRVDLSPILKERPHPYTEPRSLRFGSKARRALIPRDETNRVPQDGSGSAQTQEGLSGFRLDEEDFSLDEFRIEPRQANPTTRFNRKFPNSAVDTPNRKKNTNPHILFLDEEIVGDPIQTKIWRDETGKTFHIGQQQALKGCGQGVVRMVLRDLSIVPQEAPPFSSLTSDTTLIHWFAQVGLEGISVETKRSEILETLQPLLDQGSVIVSISDKKLGGHWIIVDEINEIGVRLRDPYHGWMITVRTEAFLHRISKRHETLVWIRGLLETSADSSSPR